MNDQELDKLIKESLTAEEAAYYDELDEPNLFEKMTLIYKGKNSWISYVQSIAMIGIFAFGVYAAIMFFEGKEVVEMLKWGFGAMFAMAATGTVKIFLVMYMQEKSMMRELKRLELQLSHFAKEKN